MTNPHQRIEMKAPQAAKEPVVESGAIEIQEDLSIEEAVTVISAYRESAKNMGHDGLVEEFEMILSGLRNKKYASPRVAVNDALKMFEQ